MKSLLRSFLINVVSLFGVANLVGGFYFSKGNETLLLTALVLGLVNLFVRPLINLLLLPINLLTLGTFRWVVNVVALFVVTLIVPDFKIIGFNFPGFSFGVINLPPYSAQGILVMILNSFLLSLISSFLFWIAR